MIYASKSSFLALIFLIVAVACQKTKDDSQATKSIDDTAIAVSLAPVEEGSFSRPIICSGLVSTDREARLAFKVGGIVSAIPIEEGQTISKGQLLATLDLTEIDAQVSQAKNNVEKSKRDLERGQRLFRDSAATLEQIQNLQTAFDVASEGYRIASFNKTYATIRATTSGKVVKKFVNEGEQVGPGTAIVAINSASPGDWIVKVGLPDVDWIKVKKGDQANITTDSHPGMIFQATVNNISEATEPVSGLYQLEIKINPTDKKLAAGMVARVEIVPSERMKLNTVPIEAIIEGNGSSAFVFVPDQSQTSVKKVKVKVSYLTGDRAFISEGLVGIANVVVGGSAFLTESSSIRIAK